MLYRYREFRHSVLINFLMACNRKKNPENGMKMKIKQRKDYEGQKTFFSKPKENEFL